MKKILLFFWVLAATCYADESQKMHIDSMFLVDGSTLAASGTCSHTVNLDVMRPVGFASLQVTVSGSGTLKVEHQSSNDGLTYATEADASDIVTALTAGNAFYAFDVPFCRFLKLVFTETGGANTVTLDQVELVVQ